MGTGQSKETLNCIVVRRQVRNDVELRPINEPATPLHYPLSPHTDIFSPTRGMLYTDVHRQVRNAIKLVSVPEDFGLGSVCEGYNLRIFRKEYEY